MFLKGKEIFLTRFSV